ncbi:MAG TPA: hypothetical protein VGR63_02420, partial [Casimicrobiaceae bacterium]|nr:hypothetical protein [Casimicrobiaceae bacterium]
MISDAPKASARHWRPEGSPVNCCLPKELRNIEDYFSPTRWRVFEAMTTKATPGFATRRPDHSWHTKGSYGYFAAIARVCPKTAQNMILQARAMGLMQVFETVMQGGRRIETHYVIRPFAVVLAELRKKAEYFHTAAGHTVGVGRNPRILTAAEAAAWKINPNAPPPPRSAGPLPSPAQDATRRAVRKARPAITSAADLEMVCAAFERAQVTADRELATQAIAAASGSGEVSAEAVAALILAIARDYKANPAYPKPTAGWFLKKLPGYAAALLRQTPEPHA